MERPKIDFLKEEVDQLWTNEEEIVYEVQEEAPGAEGQAEVQREKICIW